MKSLYREYYQEQARQNTRRQFLRNCSMGLGALALNSLLGCSGSSLETSTQGAEPVMAGKYPNFSPTAKRVIFLHMAGGPSQFEMFDYKPLLHRLDGQPCPDSLLQGKKFAFIQGVPRMLGPKAGFAQYGQSGAWVSDQLPHFQKVVDEVCLLKAVHTDQFNHGPAQLFMHTGFPQLGRPSMGSWVSYGLGSDNNDLPSFVVLVSGGKTPSAGKSVWGSGFLPSVYQGVQCRSTGEPVLYVNNPDGMPQSIRKRTIEAISRINREHYESVKDPEILTRIAQYELAYRMQLSVPEVMDITREPESIHQMYGTAPGQSSFANNCLLARKLVEEGVRFVQLYHWGWDTHGANPDGALTTGLVQRCLETDQAIAALLTDLKQRGLLEDTLVVWGGEFGRTPMEENRNGQYNEWPGRDHHPDAFTMWMAGGGIKPGMSFGETDEIGYFGVKDRVHIHDLQATILHTLGLDHEQLTYPFQGRDFRLTDVHGKVVKEILA